MASGQLQPVIDHLRQLVGRQGPEELSDQTLLEQFAARHEEAIFETLLRRHGPLVLGVCRRTLGHEQDAEDVFQATFLLLARKAGSIRKQASLGSWLHGVAYRLALKARAAAARRRTHERRCGAMSPVISKPDPGWHELQPVLDEELQRLPARHREPLVLCYLEGKTHGEAAQALGWSLGSMSKRLARARELLRGRLQRRGIALSAAALGVLADGQARAAVPAALLQTSLRAAVLSATGQAVGVASPAALTLMAGGLRTMFYTRLCRLGVIVATCVLVFGGIGLVAQQWTARANPENPNRLASRTDDAGQPAQAATDLSFVPANAIGFLHIAVHDVWSSPALRGLHAQAKQELPELLRDLPNQTGVSLDDLQAATFIILKSERAGRPEASEVTAVTTIRPYTRERVVQKLVGKAEEKKENGKTYFAQPGGNPGTAVYPLNPHTFIVGNLHALQGYLSAKPGSEGPLGPALKLAGQKHVAVLAFQVPAFLAQALHERRSRMSPVVQFLKPAFEAKSGTAVLDGNEQSLRLRARLRYADADTAQQAEDAIKVGMNMLRQQLTSGLPPEARSGQAVAELFQAASHALRTAKVTRQEAVVDVRLESKATPVLTSALPALIEVRKSADRMSDGNNLKQIGLAMHNYYLDHNHFPAHAIYSKNGKPLLSWRVAILPYIEQGNLYNQFRLNEPWDSDHNKRLLRRMPITYRPVQGKAGPFETFYQVFTGKQTMFPPGKNGSRFPDITDGTAGTLMIAEAAKAVPWTKPEDLPYSPDKPLPRLGGEFENGSNAAFADGSVHWIPKGIDPKTLRALITPRGGEKIDWSKVERPANGAGR